MIKDIVDRFKQKPFKATGELISFVGGVVALMMIVYYIAT